MVLSRNGAYVADTVLSAMADTGGGHAKPAADAMAQRLRPAGLSRPPKVSGRSSRRSSRSGGSRLSVSAGSDRKRGHAYPSARSRSRSSSRGSARSGTPDSLNLFAAAHDKSVDPLQQHGGIGAFGVVDRGSRPSTTGDGVEMERQRRIKNLGFGRETPPSVRSNNTRSVRSLFDEFDENRDGVLDDQEVAKLVAAHPQLESRVKDLDEDHDGKVDFTEFQHEVDHNGRPLNTVRRSPLPSCRCLMVLA